MMTPAPSPVRRFVITRRADGVYALSQQPLNRSGVPVSVLATHDTLSQLRAYVPDGAEQCTAGAGELEAYTYHG